MGGKDTLRECLRDESERGHAVLEEGEITSEAEEFSSVELYERRQSIDLPRRSRPPFASSEQNVRYRPEKSSELMEE